MKLKDRYRHWRRKMKFNRQYRRGKWDKLASEHERVRYDQIDAYLHQFMPKSILDLGCGDGVLNKRMTYTNFETFLGVDYSEVSIKKARKHNFLKARFETHDLLHFVPETSYDSIILNEAFYYIHDSEKNRVLDILLDSLNSDGVLIVSIFREGTGCWEYFKDNKKLTEVDFKTVQSTVGDTYWKIGAYKKAKIN